ncbi:MAG: ABC transporter permease [Bacteroidetes bacterium]|nr:ABC transporter permease [Bacteroidota bacterium]
MRKITKYVIIDILKNKIVIGYTFLLLVLSFSVLSLEDNSAKAVLTLLNIILIMVPLVNILFASVYVYNSAEFMELMASQPLKRKQIWFSVYLGLSISLSIAFLLGVGVPVLLYAASITGYTLILVGLLLSLIFVSIAMFAVVRIRDKAKGIGMAILLWLYFALLFDGLVLFILFQFEDYPLEKAMVALSLLNPVDIGRIMVLIKTDASMLMGYTGAIFRNFFGATNGQLITSLVLLAWIIIPFWLSSIKFRKKDL